MSAADPNLDRIAAALGGDISGGEVLAPGPGHSAGDRSLSVKPDAAALDGFLVRSFAGDDQIACRDYVREKLGLPKREAGKSKDKSGEPQGREYREKVARALHKIAASIKVVDLYPERDDGSDVTDFVGKDRAGCKFVQA